MCINYTIFDFQNQIRIFLRRICYLLLTDHRYEGQGSTESLETQLFAYLTLLSTDPSPNCEPVYPLFMSREQEAVKVYRFTAPIASVPSLINSFI